MTAHVLEVDLLGVRRRSHEVVWWLLCFYFAGLDQELGTEKGKQKKKEEPKSTHVISLQT